MQYTTKPTTTGVFSLVRAGNLDTLKSVLKDFNYQEVEGNGTVLTTAAAAGHLHIVNFLIKGGAEIDLRDKDGRTALMLAVTNNRLQCVQTLLDHGADPNICSKNGWSSLYTASSKGYTEITTIILYSYSMHKLKGRSFPHLLKVNVDAQNMVGGTALMAACGQGHLEVVQHLVGWNANVNAVDGNRFTALMKAAEKGHTQIVQLLLLQGASVNAVNTTGATALHLAAKVGSTDTVKALVTSPGININSVDKTSRTALFYAAQNGHLAAVHELWARGADASIVDKSNKTAITVTTIPKIVELLQQSPPFIVPNALFMSPLSSAAADVPTPFYPEIEDSVNSKNPSLRPNLVALKYTEIPLFLRNSAFFKALNEEEDEENVIQVPGDCFKVDDSVTNVDDFRLLLRVTMFWGIDRLPFTVIKFCHDHDISMWDYVADDILAPDQADDAIAGPDSTLLRSLSFVFRAQTNMTPLALAITDGRMEIIEALVKLEPHSSKECMAMTTAAGLGRLDVMTFLWNSGFEWDATTCRQAAVGGHIRCLRFAHEHGCPWDVQTHIAAASTGHIFCLKYAHEQGLSWHESVSHAAAQNNQLDCLRYVLEQGCPASENVTLEAAKAGFIECLACAIERGCPISDQACATAARGGHIECLTLLHENGANWDINAPREAAQHGRLDCLDYLRRNGCPWDESAPDAAARTGNIDILRYLMYHYCPYGNEVLKLAAEAGSLVCVKYMIEDLGLYMNDDGSVFEAAFRRADVDMVEYLLEVGCPCQAYQFNTVKLAKPMGARFDDDLLRCIELAMDRGWEANQELMDYVTQRGLTKCKYFLQQHLSL